jgi:thymidylate synthase
MVSAWNVDSLDKMKLPPCHYGFQCYTYEMDLKERCLEWCKSLGKDVSYSEDVTHEWLDEIDFPKRKLSLKWHQNYCYLGILPRYISFYSLLLNILSKSVNMIPDELIFSGGDCYIEDSYKIKESIFTFYKVEISTDDILNINYEDLKIIEL